MIADFVSGEPVAQPRHRASQQGGFARMYLPARHPVRAWKKTLALSLKHHGQQSGPLFVSLAFTFTRPKSKTRKKAPNLREPHAAKPDIDNLVKAVCDALNGVLWVDDSQIARLEASKHIAGDGQMAGVLISVEQMKSGEA